MPDHPAEFLMQEKPKSANQSWVFLQQVPTLRNSWEEGNSLRLSHQFSYLPPQIAIPLLTLPLSISGWVLKTYTYFFATPHLSCNLWLSHPNHDLTPMHRCTSGLFGKKNYISHKTGVCACRKVSGKVQWSVLGFPDPTLLFVLHSFSC